MSTDAKTLYGILLDRMGLSVKNGWLDEQGRVYIIFPVQEVMDALGCADNKATKLFRELEKFGLIERKRRGLGKPDLIYVKNFADPRFRNREKNGSGNADSGEQDAAKQRRNKTEWNNTEMSETDPFLSEEGDDADERTRLEAYFMQSLEVDLLLRLCPDEEDTIHQIVNLEYDFYLTVQENNGLWEYALYQGDCSLLERGKLDAPELMIEEVRDEIVYTHNLGKNACISLSPEEFAQKLADREEIQSYRMKQFQQSGQDCYLLMQLKRDADPALRFASMRYLEKQNIAPSIENYEILYRGNLPTGKRSVPQPELLEQLYQKFNCAQPMDYHGHSLSVSDVIMLNQDGKILAHYVDSIGFKELPGFLDKKPERTSVLQTLKEKCDAPECNPTVCRKVRNAHEL